MYEGLKIYEHGLFNEDLLEAFDGIRNPHNRDFRILGGFLEVSIETLEDIYCYYDITPFFLFFLAKYVKENKQQYLIDIESVDFRIWFEFLHKPDPRGIIPADQFVVHCDFISNPHKRTVLSFTKLLAKKHSI